MEKKDDFIALMWVKMGDQVKNKTSLYKINGVKDLIEDAQIISIIKNIVDNILDDRVVSIDSRINLFEVIGTIEKGIFTVSFVTNLKANIFELYSKQFNSLHAALSEKLIAKSMQDDKN